MTRLEMRLSKRDGRRSGVSRTNVARLPPKLTSSNTVMPAEVFGGRWPASVDEATQASSQISDVRTSADGTRRGSARVTALVTCAELPRDLRVGRGGRRGRQRSIQCRLQHFVHRLDEVQLENIEDVLGNVREVLLVVLRQDDVCEAR